ncbi:MAG: glycosyltransferase family 39 protein [Anaerolineae bacterium]
MAALTQRSLWLDEGATLARLYSTWDQLWRNRLPIQGLDLTDGHPPLYFAALKAWMAFAGGSEFALKYLSPLVCILSVPMGYAAGRRLRGRGAGLALAAFLALSPGLIWYATELRPYAFVLPISALALYVLLCFFNRPTARFALLALFVLLTGVATNYLFAGILICAVAALALFVFIQDMRQTPRRYGRSLLIVGAAIVGGAASLVAIWPLFGWFMQAGIDRLRALQLAADLPHFALLGAGAIFGQNAADFSGGAFTLAALALACVGWVTKPPRAVFLAALPFVLALFGLTILLPGTAAFRYVLFAIPAFFLLITRALFAIGRGGALRRVMAFGLGAGLLGLEMFGAVSTLTPSPTWQDDWRSLSRYIHANWQDGDSIVIRDIYTPDQVMKMYLGNLTAPLTPVSQLPESPLAAPRVWLVNTGGEDPASINSGMFTRMWQREVVGFGGWSNTLELRLYENGSPLVAQIPSNATHVSLPARGAGGGPILAAAETRAGSPLALHPDVWLTAYWKRNGASDLAQYSLAVRLVSGGQVWNTAQLPADLGQLTGWDEQFARIDYRVLTPVGLPQLPYELQITLQRGDKKEPVTTYIFPADINTWRIPSHEGALPAKPVWSSPNATLLAAEFEREFHPGDAVPLVLTWQKDNPAYDRWDSEVWIKPLLGGAAINQIENKNGDALVGSPVRAMLSAKIPETASAGWYRLGVDRVMSDGRDSIPLGFIRVSDFPITPLPDAPAHLVTARVGEFDVLGYRLNQPFERKATLSFFTYWKANAQPRRDGALFLFVLGPDGKLVAQDDNPPEGRSTLTFRAGEQIRQLHRVVVPYGAAPGAYHLFAGIYNRSDIARWEATQNGAPAKDNLVDLGTIELK